MPDTRVRRAEETVRSILRISKRLTSTLDVDSLLDLLVQESIQLVNATSGVAGLARPEGMVCQRYVLDGDVIPLEYCWPPLHGLPGWLLVHKVPYLTNDVRSDGQVLPDLCARFGIASALSTPILGGQGSVLGFFEIHNKRDVQGFTDADRDQLLGVSQVASIAIQNALAYRKLQEAEEALREADRRKNVFLATLAHELRNPLAPIRNSLHILKLASERQVREQARAVMERQVQQMVRLVDDLLDVSRVTLGKVEIRKERIELRSVIQSSVESTRPMLQHFGHQLVVTLPSDPVYIDADPTRLAQVFGNLLNNACKFTKRGGRIAIVAEREEGKIAVTVSDDGVGIVPEAIPYLFEMFTQADRPLEREESGLGVGLSLVRALTEMHGGSVEARSEGPGRGSEFRVRLPVSTEKAPPVKGTATGKPGVVRRRVLVVDDNQDSANSLTAMLTLMGHEVRTVYDGVEAVVSAESFRPEIVLLDIGLPKLNGYDAARAIRHEPWGQTMVLVAATGWGQSGDKERARQAGFDLHMTKPLRPEAIEAVLTGKAEGWRARAAKRDEPPPAPESHVDREISTLREERP